MNTKEVGSVCVLVSGGLDSYVAYRYAKMKYTDVTPLFVDYGQPYLQKELQAIRSLIPSSLLACVRADLVGRAMGVSPTVDRQEVYGRNLLLAFYGAQYGQRVWISALATEMYPGAVPDKNPEFFYMTSAILTHIMKNKQQDTVVETPFAKLTKSDVVRLGLETGISENELRATVSCYDEVTNYCGKCSTCFKRWIALTNNNIVGPHTIDYIMSFNYAIDTVGAMRKEVFDGIESQRFSSQRKRETHNALIRGGWKNGIYPGVTGTIGF